MMISVERWSMVIYYSPNVAIVPSIQANRGGPQTAHTIGLIIIALGRMPVKYSIVLTVRNKTEQKLLIC